MKDMETEFIKKTARDYDVPFDVVLKHYQNTQRNFNQFYDQLEIYIKERQNNKN